MPRRSLREGLIPQLDETNLQVARWVENTRRVQVNTSSGSPSTFSNFDPSISPPSPISTDSDSSASDDSTMERDRRYSRFVNAIGALRDEVERARVLVKLAVPMMRAFQLYLLDHFVDHRPHLFLGRLRVWPEIFDRILDQISCHPIFHNNSENRQVPVAIQLAVFLFRAGHYGNAASLEDVAQWAGFSVELVVNFSNRVMVAILDEPDTFVNMPPHDSELGYGTGSHFHRVTYVSSLEEWHIRCRRFIHSALRKTPHLWGMFLR